MSTLRSVIDQMAAVGNDELTTRELAAEVDELLECRQIFDALLTMRTDGLSERSGHEEFGYSSPTAT